jgi:ABC-2 type transport system permease protein
MNIYLRELKAHRKSIIIWSISMLIFIAMSMQKYDALIGVEGGGAELIEMLEAMPKFLQSMWGLSMLDITSPMGYYSVLFFYLALMAAIHAGMIGSGIIAKEERDRTVEFLLVKPVTRNKIITSKLLAALTNVIIMNLAIFIPSFIVIKGISSDSIFTSMLLFMIGLFFIQIIFMCIGALAASINKNPKKSGMITMSILLSSFFISIIVDMNESFEILRFLSPFKYFDGKMLLLNGNINLGYIFLTFIIVTSCLVLMYKSYKRRDMKI